MRDTTSRNVRQSEQRLSGILKISADAIISMDEQQRVTMFNEGAEKIFGYAKKEVIGQPLSMLLPRKSRQAHAMHVKEFASAPIQARKMGERGEIFGQRKSGEVFPAEASISKIEIEGERIYTAVLRDVTERKRAEEALANAARRLSDALKAGRAGMFDWDVATRKLVWSPETELLFGIPIGSFEGTIDGWHERVAPEDHARLKTELDQALAVRTPLLPQEYRILRGDGTIAWISSRSELTYDAEGRLSRVIGINVDITEHKLAEDVLETKVAERTRALQDEIRRREEAQAALSHAQRMEAFGQLAGGIAHDSNNLLSVIVGNLEMLEDDLGNHPGLKYLKAAQESASMGARLNQRLLTFSRRRKLEAQVVNLNDQVLAMSELLRRALGETISLTTVLAHDLWATRVDASEVENAILNLAINARDAMPKGGILRLETANAVVDEDTANVIEGLSAGDYVRLTVSDNGTGMPPEILKKAFEPFFTTKGPGKGSGLGLSTLYGFVRQSGGSAKIYSEVGRGTTVNVCLPRVPETSIHDKSNDDQTSPVQARGETILVVEDNPQVRSMALERLKRLGYRVLESDNGPSALQLLDQGNAIDLVFSDVVMPGGLSGFDLLRAIRQRNPEMPILLTSGFSEDVARSGEQMLEESKILRKPYSLAELARCLREALGD